MDRDVFENQNLLRTQPLSFIPDLQARLASFEGNLLKKNGCNIMTNEGPAAVQEAIAALQQQQPLPALQWHEFLGKAAKDHVDDIGPKGGRGHTSTDGKSMSDRIAKYGEYKISSGENISFGQNSGRDVIIQLLVDDGVPSRGHRSNMLSTDFKFVGNHSGPHKSYNMLTVIDYVGGFVVPGEKEAREAAINAFMREPVDFEDMPADHRGHSTQISCSFCGEKAEKTVTCTVNMPNGSKKTLVKVIERLFP